jgi:hypothetical protein
MDSILDQRTGRERRALQPFGNGKAEWAWRIASVIVAVLVAWMAVTERIARLEERQATQFNEIQRFMQRIDGYILQDKGR